MGAHAFPPMALHDQAMRRGPRADEKAPLHGEVLTPEEERLLRGRPPTRALRWCAESVGRGAAVLDVRPLAGGTSSAVHAVDLRDGRGVVRRLVLRRFVRADWLAEEPDLAAQEAVALTIAQAVAVPTPVLVAHDPDGGRVGAPAILMTRLDGAVIWRPADLEPFLRDLAAILPAIHAAPVSAARPLRPYSPYGLRITGPPRWTARPAMWRQALAALRDPPPMRRRCFVHRDFHPGNVLWRDGAVTGLVDWASASVGDPDADVGHCRMNLAGVLGVEAADRFLALHRSVAGAGDYHPFWDIAAALGGFEDADLDAWTPADEEFLARAVARL
jgi:aminoglycoside phosphotransferase (APT) family kinase protein